MNIGIVVAMDKELNLLLPLMDEPRTTVIDDVEFHLGDISGHQIVAMKSGIGKVNAALSVMELIRQFAPDLVINTGVAGGAGAEAQILDVVVGDRIAYHDVWCGPGTVDGQAARCPQFFTSDERILDLDCINGVDGIYHGLIASGDRFINSGDDLEKIRSLYPDVMAVDMESAAIAHACHLMNTPFLALRVVSDTPGAARDNAAQYDNFWEDAPRQTFEVLTRIIGSL